MIQLTDAGDVTFPAGEPSPEDYCLTAEQADAPDNNIDNWPVWYAEVGDLHAQAVRLKLQNDANYRFWRGKTEDHINARNTKTTVAAAKAEVEASKRFHQFKTADANIEAWVSRLESWKRAIELRMLMAVNS